jgi:hypothetical protein
MSNKKSLQEHLERMKYVSKYAINETPKYKSLVGSGSINPLPEYLMKEAGKPEDAPVPPAAPAANAPVPPAGDAPVPPAGGMPPMPPAGGGGAPAPAPAAPAPPAPDTANTNVDITTAQDDLPIQPDAALSGGEPAAPVESPEKRAMQLQLDALRKMSEKIEDLGSTMDNLNQRLEIYSTEVDKVREPSDMEKFENRKVDSSPYYFNLNDLWKDDNFKARMDQFSKGYVKTEDGYIADFDDLEKLPPHEVKASFDV